jgi:mannose-1-phosphate guanylyltransferase
MRYAVIMAGGTGTRFWPESRKALPKQLLRLGSTQSLLERTVRRIEPLIPVERMLLVTGDALVDCIHEHVPGLPAQNLLTEPLRRNTGPCMALAAKVLLDRDPDAVLAALSADHLIQREPLFREIVDAAMTMAAERDVLITLGITPSYPETGYGYIEVGEEVGRFGGHQCLHVAAFHEKPDLDTAVEYVASGRYLWNSGMFAFRADALWRAIEIHLPELAAEMGRIDGRAPAEKIKQQIDEIYPRLQPISLDVGVMEKADNVLVFPADIGWSDVGSWTTLRELIPADDRGNVAHGDHLILHGNENIIFARDGIVVAIGVENLIIVHTPDATLVARRDDAQAIKRIFDELEKRGLDRYM